MNKYFDIENPYKSAEEGRASKISSGLCPPSKGSAGRWRPLRILLIVVCALVCVAIFIGTMRYSRRSHLMLTTKKAGTPPKRPVDTELKIPDMGQVNRDVQKDVERQRELERRREETIKKAREQAVARQREVERLQELERQQDASNNQAHEGIPQNLHRVEDPEGYVKLVHTEPPQVPEATEPQQVSPPVVDAQETPAVPDVTEPRQEVPAVPDATEPQLAVPPVVPDAAPDQQVAPLEAPAVPEVTQPQQAAVPIQRTPPADTNSKQDATEAPQDTAAAPADPQTPPVAPVILTVPDSIANHDLEHSVAPADAQQTTAPVLTPPAPVADATAPLEPPVTKDAATESIQTPPVVIKPPETLQQQAAQDQTTSAPAPDQQATEEAPTNPKEESQAATPVDAAQAKPDSSVRQQEMDPLDHPADRKFKYGRAAEHPKDYHEEHAAEETKQVAPMEQQKSGACDGSSDPFAASASVEYFTPPVNAPQEVKDQWKKEVDALVDEVSKLNYGGKALREFMDRRVGELKQLRYQLFCSYV